MLSSATKASANMTKDLAENDLRSTVRDIENEGHHTIDKISDYASKAGEKVRAAFDRTADTSSKLSHRVEDQIKSNPVRSSALALGAGFILGALLARR